ncbi:MAG: ATP-binding cassette domain-containing protein [Sedimentisphaerales bacterium]|nr:ATP-binding cassette domain-containing protein [Sedimentisphaerales bacterium]
MAEPIIEMKHVCKSFSVPVKGQQGWKSIFYRKNQTVDVLNNINFSIDEGEFIGYIGPNGAGKSTTIKLLTGILYPSRGDIRVMDYNPHRDRYHYTYHIGVVFGQRSLLEFDIPVMDSFKLYQAIYELDGRLFQERLDEFTHLLKLDDLLHVPVRKLSLGQRMRCEIAASLLHRPKVIFLDEPTIGLDALSKHEIRQFLTRINQEEKVTIILTTHDMGDIEQLCERIVFINVGNIVYDGPLDTLKNNYITHKDIVIVYEEPIDVPDAFVSLLKEKNITTYTFNVPNAEVVSIVPALLQLGAAYDVSIHEPTLEDVVKIIYSNHIHA